MINDQSAHDRRSITLAPPPPQLLLSCDYNPAKLVINYVVLTDGTILMKNYCWYFVGVTLAKAAVVLIITVPDLEDLKTKFRTFKRPNKRSRSLILVMAALIGTNRALISVVVAHRQDSLWGAGDLKIFNFSTANRKQK